MSVLDKDAGPRLARTAAARATIFVAIWLMIAGPAVADLPIGLVAAAAATWASLRLLPSGRSRLRPRALAALVLHFLRQSVASGAQVARIALDPRLPLRPGFIVYPLHLRPGGARDAFCVLSSLLPGTLPAGSDQDDRLIVHCLDLNQSVTDNLAVDEALFIAALGHD